MLRRPATVVGLDNTDLAQFYARSEERIRARKAKAQQDLLARQQKQHERVQQQELDMSQVSPRSGRRKKLRLENEAPSRGASAMSKSNARRIDMLADESSMIETESMSSVLMRPPRHDASPSNGRSGGRMQQYEAEDETEEPEAEEGMDLDADIPDGDLDLDADVPDMDNTVDSDEDEEEDEDESHAASTTIDTSGVDVDMSTPTAPARITRAAAGGRSGTPTAGHIRSQNSSMTTTPSGPPPNSSAARAAPARRTRSTQAPQQPQQGPSRRTAELPDDVYNALYPPPHVSQMRTTQYAPPAQPAPQTRRRNGSPLPSNGTSFEQSSRSDASRTNPLPLPQPQYRGQSQQHPQQADTELHSRRRIQEETEAVRERERARRARILGGQQTQAQAASGRMAPGHGQQGMPPPPPPPSYGGVPGAPARGAAGRTARR